MRSSAFVSLVFLSNAFLLCAQADIQDLAQRNPKLLLKRGWRIQPSSQVQATAEVISTTGFSANEWYRTSVPSTVLAALVQERVYQDPYFGNNLRAIAGNTYSIGSEDFMLMHMPPESPFRSSWWYRTEFKVPSDFEGKTAWLHFDGVNYRANIWMNGHQIATSKQVAGTWRIFEFDVSQVLLHAKTNVLAVEVFPPQPDDLAITFVDWSPTPPDKCMGLWREVYLTTSGPVAIRYPQVISRLDLPSLHIAHLTVATELRNSADHSVRGTLSGRINNVQFAQTVEIGPRTTKIVTFLPGEFNQLNLRNPLLWWPAQLGPQNLHCLNLRFEIDNQVSDQQSICFGIRQVEAEVNAQDHLVFRINGKKILIRGAGYSFDMLLRSTPERQQAELDYVRDMNLNTIRMEGKLEDDHFLEQCDRYGILVLAGWCCCDQWEQWPNWKDENYTIAAESLKDQIRRLRSHPSLLSWMNGSDFPPPPKVEETYLKILKEYNWPNPSQSSATAAPTAITGKTGVKMTGPYLYVPPSYWLLDKTNGGAHGFNTETCPGPAIPPVDSLRRMFPAEHLWPPDSYWDYHAEGGEFKSIQSFTEALNGRYGPASSLEDYAEKAQVMAYEAYRAMFEAYGRNKYTSTGVIGWMLNSSWPSLHYHLYDYFLRPGGAYFATKKACEPLHIQYSYDDRSIVVVNSHYHAFPGLRVSAKVFALDAANKFSKSVTADIDADSSTRLFTVPEIEGLTSPYFLSLALTDAHDALLSSNFYWLPMKPDVLDWEHSVRLRTPVKSYADFTNLNNLPKIALRVSAQAEVKGENGITHVSIENPSQSVAFFIHLKLKDGLPPYDEEVRFHEQEVLPVLWEDNFFSLMPGETRQIKASYRVRDLPGNTPVIEVSGWNVLQASSAKETICDVARLLRSKYRR